MLGDPQTRAQRRIDLCQRIGNHGCEHGRAKRSADNRQLQRLAIRVRQLVDLEEGRANRHAGNEMHDLVGKVSRAFPAQREMAAPAGQQMVGTPEMGILFMQHGRNAGQARGQHRRKGRIAAEPDHGGGPPASQHGKRHDHTGTKLQCCPDLADQATLEGRSRR